MKNFNKNVKGVTLVSLITTIIVLIILSSIAVYSGKEVLKSSKFTKFTTEMKIMQTQVNQLYDEYKKRDNDEILNLGKEINTVQKQAEKVFSSDSSGITDQTGYRYFDQETIKNLNIEGVEQEFFINIGKRSVVSYKGIKYEGVTYHTLEQLPSGLYNVEYEDKNTGKPTFEASAEEIGKNKWKINISNIQYSGYIEKWKVNYKLEGQEYWNTSKNYSFIVKESGKYIIQLVNGMITSEEKEVIIEQASILPDGYQQVEYIESTGTQYINTGFIPNQNTRVICKTEMEFNADSGTKTYHLFGARESINTGMFSFSSWGAKYETKYNSQTTTAFSSELTGKFIIDKNKNITTLSYENGDLIQSVEQSIGEFTPNINLFLFATNENNKQIIGNLGNKKIYYCKIWDNDVLVRDFISCYKKDTGEIGLYDTVEGKFYTNQGTGTEDFEKGVDVNSLPAEYQQVEYIESTGTQYIDTNYKLTSKSKVEIKFEMTSKESMCIFGSRTSATLNNFGIFYDTYYNGIVVDFYDWNKNRLTAVQSENELITVTQSKEKATVNEKSQDISYYVDFETPTNAYIFYISNSQPYPEKYAKIKLYSCKIWEEDVLVRDFIPCYYKKNTEEEIGLYDTVSGEFYTNQGTGTFLKGDNVNVSTSKFSEEFKQIEYIQLDSTDPQSTYIVTDIPVSQISTVICKYGYENFSSDWNPMMLSTLNSNNVTSTPYVCTNGTKTHTDVASITPTIPKSLNLDPTEFTVTYNSNSENVLKIGGWSDNYWTPVGSYYYVQVFDKNNNLIFDGIPCYRKLDNEIGMYDKVNDKFYINQGTGTFEKGAEVN